MYLAIKVCDTIMGSGKTSAVINLMDSHPERKYLYITPFLTETERILQSCKNIEFVTPERDRQHLYNKQNHLQELVEADMNISITQALFKRSTQETIELIKSHSYTVIIDEAVDVFQPFKISDSDYELVERAGLIVEQDAEQSLYSVKDFGYSGGVLQEFFSMARYNRIVKMGDGAKNIYHWQLPKELFEVSEDMYILTYMFDCSTLRYFFDLNQIEYQYIYVNKDDAGIYSFTDELKYMPAYVAKLSDTIHIFENDKLNAIGNNRTSLSSTWYKNAVGHKNDGRIERLRKNVGNYFKHYTTDIPASGRLWSTFKNGTGAIRSKGFYNSNLEFNCKATNMYSDKKALAYCVNIFMHPDIKNYFIRRGIDADEDRQALSTMIQWIWRSAIRNGEEIWIYIPSRRMRTLLKNWIKETQEMYFNIINNKEVDAIA